MPKVLVIDDDAHMCLILSKILSKQGFEILTAADGQSGIRQALDHRPDLIILDIIMPGMDGIEVAARLRAEPDCAGIPIVFLTAYASSRGRAAANGAAVDGFITKPFMVDEVVETVTALIAAAGSPTDA